MRLKQGILFCVLLVTGLFCLLFPMFLPDDASGASPGLCKALAPVFQKYESLQPKAAAGILSGKSDPALVKARQDLNKAQKFTPSFESEKTRSFNGNLRAALDEYAGNIEQLSELKRPASSIGQGAGDSASGPGLEEVTDEIASYRKNVADALAIHTQGADRGVKWQGALMTGGMLLVPGAFLVAFLPGLLRGMGNWRIRRAGVSMLSVVVSARPTGLMVNFQPEYEATVRLPDGSNRLVILRSFDGVTAGTELQVLVAPHNHQRAVLA